MDIVMNGTVDVSVAVTQKDTFFDREGEDGIILSCKSTLEIDSVQRVFG